MTEEVFDVLKREALDTDQRVERAIMQDRTVGEIMDAVSTISEALDRTRQADRTDLAAFDFVPNADISGHHGVCSDWKCRVRRAGRLARFAVLWADHVLIPSYLGDYMHHAGVEDWKGLRYQVAGDLKVMLALRPMLESGVIRLFNPWFHFCRDCGRTFEAKLAAVEETLASTRERLEILYLDEVRVWFISRAACRGEGRFAVRIEGPEDVVPCGSHMGLIDKPPNWLPARLKRRAEQGDVEYEVPRRGIRATGLLSGELSRVAEDVIMQHVLSMQWGTKYLTNRRADVPFLRALNQRDDYATWTDLLTQYLQYEMPIIEGVPLDELVAVRGAEHDAFLVYRDTLRDVIRNHIAERHALSGREAQEIYEDVVQPSLNKMRARLTSIRRSLLQNTGRKVVITGGLVAVGVFSGLLPADLAAVVTAVGGLNVASEVLGSLASLRSSSTELRSENLYFLWKIGERAAGRRPARVA